MTANSSLQNLYVDVQGSTEGGKPGGELVERVITIRNQGDRLAELEVWLEPSDMRAEPLRQWGIFNQSELTLQPQQSDDVVLTFRIPVQAEPGFYSYDVRVRSPQYQGEEIRRSQQLQVLVSGQDALRTEPKITLTPATDSINPHRLKAGTEMVLGATVENPSRRTDRFFLTCPDLFPEWFTVIYPEKQGDGSIPVEQTDGLQLNPRETGQIQLKIHPPAHAPSGNYFPTVRITSSNRSDLVILEVIYLTIPIDDRLSVELTPKSRKVPSEADTFDIHLANPGNINRTLAITAADPDQTFHYTIRPYPLILPPGESATAVMKPRPRHWWRQLWRMREQTLEFTLDVQNFQTDPASRERIPPHDLPPEALTHRLLALPGKVPVGRITWKVRRRWLFWLLLSLLCLGTCTAVVWLLWHFLIFRPSLRPRIAEFATRQEDYQEGADDAVTFDWQITNLEKIGRVQLNYPAPTVAESPTAPQLSATPKTYTFTNLPDNDIPPALKPYCQVEEAPKPNSIINTLLSLYRRFTQRSPNPQALTCKQVPLADFVVAEGTYDFQLLVFPIIREKGAESASDQQESTLESVSDSVADRQKITKVEIAPLPPPEIKTFMPTAIEYRLRTPDAGLSQNPQAPASSAATNSNNEPEGTNGQKGTTTRSASDAPSQDGGPLAPIRLDWEISNFEEIASLTLVSLAPDGSEHALPETFNIQSKDEAPANAADIRRLPPRLQPFCQIVDNTLLCRRVRVLATDVGEYVFYLTVTPRRDQGQGEIVKSTATIPIKPPMPTIEVFALNGKDRREHPKHVFEINPARVSLDVVLSWRVENAIQVELLPAPGVMEQLMLPRLIEQESLPYTLSAVAGSETITLRAINELEEEVIQSIVIEKVGFDPAQPVSPAAANAEAGGVLPPPPRTVPVPTVPIPRRLPPADVPPRAN